MKRDPRVSSVHLSYFAGIFDGEGSIILASDGAYVRLRAAVQMYDPTKAVIPVFHARWGGCLRLMKFPAPRIKPMRRWDVVGEGALQFLKEIYPHLRIKRKQARLAFEFWETCKARKSFEHDDLTDQYRLKMSYLNKLVWKPPMEKARAPYPGEVVRKYRGDTLLEEYIA